MSCIEEVTKVLRRRPAVGATVPELVTLTGHARETVREAMRELLRRRQAMRSAQGKRPASGRRAADVYIARR